MTKPVAKNEKRDYNTRTYNLYGCFGWKKILRYKESHAHRERDSRFAHRTRQAQTPGE